MRIKRIVVPLEELQRRRNGNIAAEIKAVDELPDAVVDTITGKNERKAKDETAVEELESENQNGSSGWLT